MLSAFNVRPQKTGKETMEMSVRARGMRRMVAGGKGECLCEFFGAKDEAWGINNASGSSDGWQSRNVREWGRVNLVLGSQVDLRRYFVHEE
ncbi:MAG: hypothetical protein ACQKBU_00655 [Verrucomicrobiales bacterium]